MNYFKIYTPSQYLDIENKVIPSPKIKVSNFNVEIGQQKFLEATVTDLKIVQTSQYENKIYIT